MGAIEALLFMRDPIGINFEENTDEYRSEAETITLRLRGAKDPNDVPGIVYEEFVHWFGKGIAGPEEQYRDIAADIWEIWSAWRRKSHRQLRAESGSIPVTLTADGGMQGRGTGRSREASQPLGCEWLRRA